MLVLKNLIFMEINHQRRKLLYKMIQAVRRASQRVGVSVELTRLLLDYIQAYCDDTLRPGRFVRDTEPS